MSSSPFSFSAPSALRSAAARLASGVSSVGSGGWVLSFASSGRFGRAALVLRLARWLGLARPVVAAWSAPEGGGCVSLCFGPLPAGGL